MLLCSGVLSLVLLLQEGGASRPWTVELTSLQRYQELKAGMRYKAGEGAAPWATLAMWCADMRLFGPLRDAAEQALSLEKDSDEVHALIGYERAGDEWRPAELSRFADKAPELDFDIRADLKPDEIARRCRNNEFQRAKRSECFDIWSDMEREQVGYYTEVLNEHYRNLKNRFQPHPGGQINVLLFGSWSDYLLFYRAVTGQSGESVLGYYVPAGRLLVFYHAPYDRNTLTTVIRHECTHLLVDLSYEGSKVPIWLHEGLACYLAGGGAAVAGRYTTSLVLELAERMRAGDMPDIEDLLGCEKLSYSDYASSWALVYLLNKGKRGGKFRRFMSKLRDAAGGAPSSRPQIARPGASKIRSVPKIDLREKTREVLVEQYGDLFGLRREFKKYFGKEFALTTARQLLDLGWSALERPEKEVEGRQRMVDIAQQAFDDASARAVESELAEARLGLVGCAVRKTALADPDLGSCRLMLREVRRALRELPQWPDEFLVARFAHEALWTLRRAVDLEPRRRAFDCRGALLEIIGGRRRIDESLGRSLVVLYDDVLRLAFEALARTLARDPLHRPAAHEWLRLAMDFVPSQLPRVFPTLRLLVEADPTDRNLAALAVAYAGLGEEAWAKSLFDEAKRMAVRPEHISDFAPYFEK